MVVPKCEHEEWHPAHQAGDASTLVLSSPHSLSAIDGTFALDTIEVLHTDCVLQRPVLPWRPTWLVGGRSVMGQWKSARQALHPVGAQRGAGKLCHNFCDTSAMRGQAAWGSLAHSPEPSCVGGMVVGGMLLGGYWGMPTGGAMKVPGSTAAYGDTESKGDSPHGNREVREGRSRRR